MQIFQSRNARSDLPMSNATRKQLGIQPEVVRSSDKHAVLATQYLHVGQQVMYPDSANKHWYPAVTDSLCPGPEPLRTRSYKITIKRCYYLQEKAITLKPFTPQNNQM